MARRVLRSYLPRNERRSPGKPQELGGTRAEMTRRKPHYPHLALHAYSPFDMLVRSSMEERWRFSSAS